LKRFAALLRKGASSCFCPPLSINHKHLTFNLFMRAVIQRVLSSSVSVNGQIVGKIPDKARGLCVLVGITHDDTQDDADYVIRKILTTRYWPDENGTQWKRNVQQIDGSLLLVSQFTLYSKFKGTKLDFHRAMGPEEAKAMFDGIVERLKKDYKEDKVETGEFGGYMNVHIENDGPVTTIVDSKQRDF